MVTKPADGAPLEHTVSAKNNGVGIKENVIKLNNTESQGIHYGAN